MNIFHPLVEFHWTEARLLPHLGSLPQCTLLNGTLYVLGMQHKLYACSNTEELISWDLYSVPARGSGLGTYHSQLVLAGGSSTNKVWVSDKGINWKPSLPPLLTRRYRPCLVNTGSPEFLVIAGGFEDSRCKAVRKSTVLEVEVLVGKQWLSIQPLPKPYYYCLGPLVHNGILYLSLVDRSRDFISHIYCKMESLVAACTQVTPTSSKSGLVWKELTECGENASCCLTTFKDKLIAIPNLLIYWNYAGAAVSLYAHLLSTSHVTSSWVNVGESLDGISAATLLPTGELVVVGFTNGRSALLKASTKGSYLSIHYVSAAVNIVFFLVSPYDPENCFSMSALCRLEAAGVPVVTSLARNLAQFIKVSGVILDEGCPEQSAEGVEEVIYQLAMGVMENPRPLIWRSLYEVLRELGLEDLNQQIEEYLISE